MNIFKGYRNITSKAFGKFANPQKGILLLICAILGGHLCDDYYQFAFPFFKIAFSCVAIIIYYMIKEIEDGEKES